MLHNLKDSLVKAPIIKRGGYDYFIHPISDGVPAMRPEILREVVTCMIKNCDLEVDKIVTIEAMGLPIAATLSMVTGLPFVIIRKRMYGLPGEIAVHQETGYSSGQLYLNDIKKGDKVLIVDDVISTGGTLIATIKALERAGATVRDIAIVIERGEGKKRIREMGYEIKTLVKIDVDSNGVKILSCIDDEC